MQIHLSTPGGEREGPFTVEQINRDLATKKYNETDYWAWYEGLEAWVPLHSVPGVRPRVAAEPPGKPTTEAPPIATELQPPVAGAQVAVASDVQAEQVAPPGKEIRSGVPVTALEHMFIFTSGEGPATMQSPVTATMVREITGEELDSLRDRVARDVFGRCDIAERLRREGTVPSAAWRAMSALKPELVQRAQEGAYHICVRTFNVQPNEVVALFLFYNKQTM